MKYAIIEGNRVYLRVGVQSFCVYEWDGDKGDDCREYYRSQLAKAIGNLIQMEAKKC